MTRDQAIIAVAALRSGEYVQRRDCIGDYWSNSHCCIGVAAKANGCPAFYVTMNAANFIELTDYQKQEWIDWNDKQLLSFNEIADRIEIQWGLK